jgi:hypothetical protein
VLLRKVVCCLPHITFWLAAAGNQRAHNRPLKRPDIAHSALALIVGYKRIPFFVECRDQSPQFPPLHLPSIHLHRASPLIHSSLDVFLSEGTFPALLPTSQCSSSMILCSRAWPF